MNKALVTVADIKKAFPEYRMFYSDDQVPVRVSIMLPKAMLVTIDLASGVLKTSIEAGWGSDEKISLLYPDEPDGPKAIGSDSLSSAEADALKVIETDLLPAWKAAGFEPTGERGFEDDTAGVEPVYSITLQKSIQTLDDVKKTIQWIAKNAETHVQLSLSSHRPLEKCQRHLIS